MSENIFFKRLFISNFVIQYMIEIVYQSKGQYPFGQERIPGHSYLEIKQQYSTEEQMLIALQKFQKYKYLKSDHLVNLERILKSQMTILLGYQYFNISLRQYISQITQQEELNIILDNINDAITTLINAGIKCELDFQNISIDQENKVKLFISPSFQILTNEKNLFQFYQTEKKKLQLQLQDLCESKQLKIKKKDTKNVANFVINGNALVFAQPNKAMDQHSELEHQSQKNQKKSGVYQSKPEPKRSLNSQGLQQVKKSDTSVRSYEGMVKQKAREQTTKSSMQEYYPQNTSKQYQKQQLQDKKKSQASKYALIQERARAAKQKAQSALNSMGKAKKP